MKIIISPAKTMREERDLFEIGGLPVFLERAEHIRDVLREMSREELRALYRANDKITEAELEEAAGYGSQRRADAGGAVLRGTSVPIHGAPGVHREPSGSM